MLYYIGAFLLFSISSLGMLVNGYCLFKFLSKKGKFSGFYKLCIVKTIPNLVISASFLFWAAPLTLFHVAFARVPRSVNIVIGQIAGSGAYVLAPITQSFMAFNRFILLYLPFWRLKYSKSWTTYIAISLGFGVAITCSVLGYEETCGYVFDPEQIVWRSEEFGCAANQSAIIFYCIVVPTVVSNSLNLASAAKLIFVKVTGVTKSDERRRRRKWIRMFLQNVFQDSLHVVDLINCRYIYLLRDDTWFQFIFLSVSFALIYCLDGLVMFYFHRDVQPIFVRKFLARRKFPRKTNAVEAFATSSHS